MTDIMSLPDLSAAGSLPGQSAGRKKPLSPTGGFSELRPAGGQTVQHSLNPFEADWAARMSWLAKTQRWMDPQLQASFATADINDADLYQSVNLLKQATVSSWDGFSRIFDDPVLEKKPSAALSLKRYITQAIGPIPIEQDHLVDVQKQLQAKGYGTGLPTDGNWDQTWNAEYKRWAGQVVKDQLAGNQPGGFTIGHALHALTSIMPVEVVHHVVGFAKAVPGALRQVVADLAFAGGEFGGDVAHIFNRNINPAQVGATAGGFVAGQSPEQFGANIIGRPVSFKPGHFGASYEGPAPIGRLAGRTFDDAATVFQILSATGAISGLAETGSAEAAKGISMSEAQRGPGAIVNTLGKGVGAVTSTAARSAVTGVVAGGTIGATQAALRGQSPGQILEQAGIGAAAGLGTSLAFENIPILNNTGAWVGKMADADGLYYKARTLVASPYALPPVRIAGDVLGQAGIEGAKTAAIGAISTKLNPQSPLGTSIENQHFLDPINDRIKAMENSVPVARSVFKGGLDDLVFFLHPGEGTVSSAVGKQVSNVVDASTDALGRVGAIGQIEHFADKPWPELVKEAGGEEKAARFWTNKLREQAAYAYADEEMAKMPAGAVPASRLDRVDVARTLTHEAYNDPEIMRDAVDRLLNTHFGDQGSFENRLRRSMTANVLNPRTPTGEVSNYMDAVDVMRRSVLPHEADLIHELRILPPGTPSADARQLGLARLETVTSTEGMQAMADFRRAMSAADTVGEQLAVERDLNTWLWKNGQVDAYSLPHDFEAKASLGDEISKRFAGQVFYKPESRLSDSLPSIPSSTWYHGTSRPFSGGALGPRYMGSEERNLFGPGLYLTQDPMVAANYTAKGLKEEGGRTVYGVAPKGKSPNLLDIERPLIGDARVAFNKVAEHMDNYDVSHFDAPEEDFAKFREAIDSGTGAEAYKAFKNLLAEGGVHDYVASEYMHDLIDNLQAAGYDGLRYQGGVRTGPASATHEAAVIFEPSSMKVASTTQIPTPSLGAHPDLKAGFRQLKDLGYKVIAGTDIGHIFHDWADAPELAGDLTRRRRVIERLGLSPDNISSFSIGTVRRTAIQQNIQKLADDGEITLPPYYTVNTILGDVDRYINGTIPSTGTGRILRWEADNALQLRDIPRKVFVDALTRMHDIPLETEGAMLAEGGDLGQMPLFTEADANKIYRAVVKGSAAPPGYMLGAARVEDLARARFGFIGDALPNTELAQKAANLPNNLISWRNRLRFNLSPYFDFRRIAKTNVKLGAEGIAGTLNPIAALGEHLDAAKSYLDEITPQFGRGTVAAQAIDDADRFLESSGITHLYNYRAYEAYAAWSAKEAGQTDDEVRSMLTRIFGYGSEHMGEGRSALERTTNFFFFPFSFDKTLYRNLGGYLLDRPGQLLLLDHGLRAYKEFNDRHLDGTNPLAASWWDKHVPLLNEAMRMNAFAHGISAGEFGGVNRPLLNLFIPQMWKADGQSTKMLTRLVPALSDFQRVWSEGSEQFDIGRTAIYNSIDAATRDIENNPRNPLNPRRPAMTANSQYIEAAKMRRDFESQYADALDYNEHHPKTPFTWDDSLAEQFGLVKGSAITRQGISSIVEKFYPAAKADFGQIEAAKAQEDFRHFRQQYAGTALYDTYDAFIKNATAAAKYISSDKYTPSEQNAETEQVRQVAIDLARQDSAFLKLYNRYFSYHFGPIEDVR